jgi:hypothetical protein
MSRKAFVLILALAVVCVLLLATWGSVRISLMEDRANSYLHKRYPLIDMDFDTARLTWEPGSGRVDLNLDNVSVTDISGDAVLGIPALVVSIEALSFFSGNPRPKVIRLERPVIRLERTVGGAIKIDLGPTADGSSGTLALTMLTDLAAQPAEPSADTDLPEIRLENAQLTLVDARSGAQFTFAPVGLVLNRVKEGLRADATLSARTAGEMLDIVLGAVFRTRDRSVWLGADFTNANPAVLSELLPDLAILEPVEIALNGRATIEIAGDMTLRAVDLLVRGGPGSLEVAQHTGANIALNTLRAELSYSGASRRLLISDLLVDLGGRRLTGHLSSAPSDAAHRTITGDLTLRNAAWSDVLPIWFAALDRQASSATVSSEREGTTQRLRFEVAATRQTGRIEGRGKVTFDRPQQGLAFEGTGTASPPGVEMFIDGTLATPLITFRYLQASLP